MPSQLPEETKISPRRRSWSWRRKISVGLVACAVLFAGVVCPLGFFIWMLFGSPAPIEISPETTWLTEPLTPDGRYVDYVEAIRSQYPKEAAAKFEDDPWQRRTLMEYEHPKDASRAAIQFLDPKNVLYDSRSDDESFEDVSARRVRFRRRVRIPFSATEDPEVAELIRQNTPWYDAITTTGPDRPAFYFPTLKTGDRTDVFCIGMPSVGVDREIALRFALRAMLRFGSGQPEDGLEDVRFILAIAERERLSPSVLSWDVASAIDTIAHDALWAGVISTATASEPLLNAVVNLPIETDMHEQFSENIDRFDRLDILDRLQEAHRTQSISLGFFTDRSSMAPWKTRWLCQRIDWNQVMRVHNERVDRIAAAFRIASFAQREAVLQTIDNETQVKLAASPSEKELDSAKELLFGDVTALMEAQCLEFNRAVIRRSETLCRDLNRRRASHLAARFNAYRQQHGSFPETLDAVLHIQGLPEAPKDVTIDAFSAAPFRYRREGEGFVLYSVGSNLVDDSIGTKSRDYQRDQIWQWPLRPL